MTNLTTPQDPPAAAPPQFDLTIEFTGLCLYVTRSPDRPVTVVLPDATATDLESNTHLDGLPAVPHVGYLRFDLGSLAAAGTTAEPGNGTGAPPNEVVHRLSRETIDLSLPAAGGPAFDTLSIPSFGDISGALEPDPAIFADSPPATVLARVDLRGGSVTTAKGNPTWTFKPEVGTPPAAAQYGSYVWWSRTLEGDGLTITLTPFGSAEPTSVYRLTPVTERSAGEVRRVVRLKIANLCADNPLEWSELGQPAVVNEDLDFKWLYQLLRIRPGTTAPDYSMTALPHPYTSEAKQGEVQDCFGAKIQG